MCFCFVFGLTVPLAYHFSRFWEWIKPRFFAHLLSSTIPSDAKHVPSQSRLTAKATLSCDIQGLHSIRTSSQHTPGWTLKYANMSPLLVQRACPAEDAVNPVPHSRGFPRKFESSLRKTRRRSLTWRLIPGEFSTSPKAKQPRKISGLLLCLKTILGFATANQQAGQSNACSHERHRRRLRHRRIRQIYIIDVKVRRGTTSKATLIALPGYLEIALPTGDD